MPGSWFLRFSALHRPSEVIRRIGCWTTQSRSSEIFSWGAAELCTGDTGGNTRSSFSSGQNPAHSRMVVYFSPRSGAAASSTSWRCRPFGTASPPQNRRSSSGISPMVISCYWGIPYSTNVPAAVFVSQQLGPELVVQTTRFRGRDSER